MSFRASRVAALALFLVACARERPSEPSAPVVASAAVTASAKVTPVATSTASAADGDAARGHRPERVVAGPDVEVASFVRATRARAVREGRKVVVEVGASWCKPCRTLTAAIDRGDLDDALADVTVIAFDADLHGPRLDSLGYRSKFVPFFAVPKPDGTSSDRTLDAKVPPDVSPRDVAAALAPLLR